MSYAALTTENTSLLKRFSHKKRFDIAIKLLEVQCCDEILDYGTGDGFFVKKLYGLNPKYIVGYEPIDEQYEQLEKLTSELGSHRFLTAKDISAIGDKKFDKVSCLEVLEHLTEEGQTNVLENVRNFLKPDGTFVVSVPIEIGFSGLIKNLIRYLLRQSHGGSSFSNVIRSLFGLKIKRGMGPYISSHVGFDYRELVGLFSKSGFQVKKRCFSPFELLGPLNSQVFFVLKLAD